MKIVSVIPARYGSSRFPGKPLADICGKPMIWWVYNQVRKSKLIDDVYVLLDDERIVDVCNNFNIPYIMTRNDHPNHIDRVKEASDKIKADLYICVNGDEPLIDPKCIDEVITNQKCNDEFGISIATHQFSNATLVMDPSNIKLVLNECGRCIYMSRGVVPYPKGSFDFNYNKYVGIECFNKKSLDLFVEMSMSKLEKIEDIDHLRFIENDIPIYAISVESESISVDTHKDLEYVKSIIMKNDQK
jgi:3-deoxy-manno-octulosonate cytidylyltransferase (CMP-KDO synthetase)